MFAELLLGQPIFPGDSGVDQLVEIIKVLGTPTKEQIRKMNSNYTEFKFPQIKAHPWNKVSQWHYNTCLLCLSIWLCLYSVIWLVANHSHRTTLLCHSPKPSFACLLEGNLEAMPKRDLMCQSTMQPYQ